MLGWAYSDVIRGKGEGGKEEGGRGPRVRHIAMQIMGSKLKGDNLQRLDLLLS